MDDRRKDGGTNSTLRTKEQGTHLTLNEQDDDDDDYLLNTHHIQHKQNKNSGNSFLKALLCCGLNITHKGKGHPRTDQQGPEGEYRYTSTLSFTSALDRVGGQRHAPAALPPVKDPVPIV